jgi:hypothetical protein
MSYADQFQNCISRKAKSAPLSPVKDNPIASFSIRVKHEGTLLVLNLRLPLPSQLFNAVIGLGMGTYDPNHIGLEMIIHEVA